MKKTTLSGINNQKIEEFAQKVVRDIRKKETRKKVKK